mmetsp:Transcript_2203/g.3179  ORF Transcript_2203/g.3179 Transcript_2203/m.3179 type:complete len:315 (+) Transcript_2203:12-956(+)
MKATRPEFKAKEKKITENKSNESKKTITLTGFCDVSFYVRHNGYIDSDIRSMVLKPYRIGSGEIIHDEVRVFGKVPQEEVLTQEEAFEGIKKPWSIFEDVKGLKSSIVRVIVTEEKIKDIPGYMTQTGHSLVEVKSMNFKNDIELLDIEEKKNNFSGNIILEDIGVTLQGPDCFEGEITAGELGMINVDVEEMPDVTDPKFEGSVKALGKVLDHISKNSREWKEAVLDACCTMLHTYNTCGWNECNEGVVETKESFKSKIKVSGVRISPGNDATSEGDYEMVFDCYGIGDFDLFTDHGLHVNSTINRRCYNVDL